MAGDNLAIASFKAERIIPTIFMENVGQKRGAHDETDLIAGHVALFHTFLELRDHFTRDKIALLDSHAIRCQNAEETSFLAGLHPTGGRYLGDAGACRWGL